MSQLLLTEEDVKAKVINEWLRNHGFGPKDISLETGFELRLGTSVHRVGGAKRRGRSDYVVRAADGRNLMVIEAKAADELLDQDSREQGISYARLLRTGGIAPFVVITNGRDTEILDTISGETVVGATIPQNHPSVTNRFRVSADDLALRNTALAAFIGLSVENLLEFCRTTVATRMQLLRSEDIASGKKYIPALNVPRRESSRALREFLRSQGCSVVLVTGRPQVGKTNFLCGFVEEELTCGNPCLFYPAVSLKKGLLHELAEDFGWTFNESTPLVHAAEKLQRVCAVAGKTMTIFIDGWNEADREVALALHAECKRLGMRGIRFVISATRLALRKLLIDSKNNCEYIADAVGITRLNLPLVEIDPSRLAQSVRVVNIDWFSDEEMIEAYRLYSEAFRVRIPESHHQTNDPFLLGVAMRLYENGTLPEQLDEPDLLSRHLETKMQRAGTLSMSVVRHILETVAQELFELGAPVLESHVRTRLHLSVFDSIPHEFFESALLTRLHRDGHPELDFYNSRERDFVIAIWCRRWPTTMTDEGVASEIECAVRSNAASDAVRWLLGRRAFTNISLLAGRQLKLISAAAGRRLVLSALSSAATTGAGDFPGLREIAAAGLGDVDALVRLEAAKLSMLIIDDAETLSGVVSDEAELIRGLVSIDEEFPFAADSAGHVVLDALRHMHWDDCPEGGGGAVTSTLEELIDHDENAAVRRAAAKAFGYIAAEEFFTYMIDRACHKPIAWADEMFDGVEIAGESYAENLFGFMCPGFIEILQDDPEQRAEELQKMDRLLTPIINCYGRERCTRLVAILDALKPAKESNGPTGELLNLE